MRNAVVFVVVLAATILANESVAQIKGKFIRPSSPPPSFSNFGSSIAPPLGSSYAPKSYPYSSLPPSYTPPTYFPPNYGPYVSPSSYPPPEVQSAPKISVEVPQYRYTKTEPWMKKPPTLVGSNGLTIPKHAKEYRHIQGGWVEYRPYLSAGEQKTRNDKLKSDLGKLISDREKSDATDTAHRRKAWDEWFEFEEKRTQSGWYDTRIKELNAALAREFSGKEAPKEVLEAVRIPLDKENEARKAVYESLRNEVEKELFVKAKAATKAYAEPLEAFLEGLPSFREKETGLSGHDRDTMEGATERTYFRVWANGVGGYLRAAKDLAKEEDDKEAKRTKEVRTRIEERYYPLVETWKTFPTVSKLLTPALTAYRQYEGYSNPEKDNHKTFVKSYVTDWVELGPKTHTDWHKRQTERLNELSKTQFPESDPSLHIVAPLVKQLDDEWKSRLSYYKDRDSEVKSELKLREQYQAKLANLYKTHVSDSKSTAENFTSELKELWSPEEKRRLEWRKKTDSDYEIYAKARNAKWGSVEKDDPINHLFKSAVAAYPKRFVHTRCGNFRLKTDLRLVKTLEYSASPEKAKTDDDWRVLAKYGKATQDAKTLTQMGKIRGFACKDKTTVAVVDWAEFPEGIVKERNKEVSEKTLEDATSSTTDRRGWVVVFNGDRLVRLYSSNAENLSFRQVVLDERDNFRVLFYRLPMNEFVTRFAFGINSTTFDHQILGGTYAEPTARDPFENQ